jgi:hypothetical protein
MAGNMPVMLYNPPQRKENAMVLYTLKRVIQSYPGHRYVRFLVTKNINNDKI